MKTSAGENRAERTGRWSGRVWRWILRQDARATRFIVDCGVPQRVAASLVLILKLGICAALLYAAFWFALVVVVLLIAAAVAAPHGGEDQPKWLEKDPDDHREDLFYHPLSYNDDPDPRFDDPRHHNK